jgi:hypothetical protein
MFTVKSRASHNVIGFIPELGQILLKDTETNKLELWRRSIGVELHSIILDGHELEFVREVTGAYRVVDDTYNRTHCPHEIGRIFVDRYPIGASVREL